jgi:dihydrofolate reductase
MKIVLVFVITLDGKITRWGNPNVTIWSSEKDKEFFRRSWNEAGLIVMGSTTYRAGKPGTSRDQRLIVMTRDPSFYENQAIAGRIEFTDESPAQLTARLEKEGFDHMLLVGGAHVATSFFKEQLVDEMWLTIEPRIFGTGGNFVLEEKLDINLNLISCEVVNSEGTLITKYAVQKEKLP